MLKISALICSLCLSINAIAQDDSRSISQLAASHPVGTAAITTLIGGFIALIATRLSFANNYGIKAFEHKRATLLRITGIGT